MRSIVPICIMSFSILTGCTFSIIVDTHGMTHGVSEDTLDDTATTEADPNVDVSVPAI